MGTLGIFKVMDNYDRADEFSRLDQDGREKWEGDRTIISDEWSRLSANSGLTMDKAAVTSPEPFSTWTHKQIWQALNGPDGLSGVNARDVNAGADGWRQLTTGTETAVNNYRTSFERVLSEKWSGESGTAAIDAVKSYTADATKLPTAFQMVANGIDHMEGLLGQAKIAIPKPENVSDFDEFISHIPGNGVVKAAKHRATEAEEDARLFMIGTYQPGSTTVDNQTPVLPVPKNDATDPGGVPGNGGNGGSNGGGADNNGNNNGGGSPATNPAATQEDPTTTTPQTTDSGDDQDDSSEDDSTEPSSTDPTATNPAATTPTGTGQPTGDKPAGTGGGSPGSGSPGGGIAGGPTAPGAGRSVAGSPVGANPAGSGARAAAGGAAGARGMSGMPGMMGGGRGGNGKDDENEHTTPDYLIQDRESELIGQLPPTLPPGGVIGA
ncbi:PPE domain-containing protein [Nocardia sp. NPDC055053]